MRSTIIRFPARNDRCPKGGTHVWPHTGKHYDDGRCLKCGTPAENVIEWHVRAWEFDTAEEAAAEWRRIEDEAQAGDGNFSVWRTGTPDGSHHHVVVCGTEQAIEGVATSGEPFELTEDLARFFALRRARVGMDAFRGSGDPEERFHQVAHYPEGRRIQNDGSVR